MNKRRIYAILFFIVILGAYLRFYKLGTLSFVADEFLDINSSYAYSQTGIWQSWDFNKGEVNTENEFAPRDERAWLYKIQVAQLFKFFPPTEFIARIVSVIWGIFSIILIYFVSSYFTKKREIGLLSAFLFAISVSGIIFDRRLRMYAMFFPVFLFFSWMTYCFYEKKYLGDIKFIKYFQEKLNLNVLFLFPMLISFLISIKIHDLTVSIAAIFSSYVLAMTIINFYKERKIFNKYFISFIILFLGAIASFVFFFNFIEKYSAGIKFFNDNFNYFSIIFTDYSHLPLAVAIFCWGIYYFKKEKLLKEGVWIVLSFLVPLFMAIFLWRRNAGSQYIFFVQSFEIIILSAGIYAFAIFAKNNINNFSKIKTYFIAILALLILLPNYEYFFEKNNTYNQTSESENPNYKSIFTYFKKKKNIQDVIITRNFRNYYMSGLNVKVYDFGGELSEEKFDLNQLNNIISNNNSGWVILSDNDERYIANDTMKYIEENMEKINDIAVRGNIAVYRWNNLKQ